VNDLIRIVREGPPAGPCIALYRIQSAEGLCISGETDSAGTLLAAGCEDSQVCVHPEPSPSVLKVEEDTKEVRTLLRPSILRLFLGPLVNCRKLVKDRRKDAVGTYFESPVKSCRSSGSATLLARQARVNSTYIGLQAAAL
jgi:hypothetical protein